MAVHYQNLPQQMQALVHEVQKQQRNNTLLVFLPTEDIDFTTTLANLSFTNTELLEAQPILERIEHGKNIQLYINRFQRFYMAVKDTDTLPTEILLNSTQENDFPQFFQSLSEYSKEANMLEAEYGTSLAWINDEYTAWQNARTKEGDKKALRNKVEQAVDFRDYLLAKLKAFGYSEKEINTVIA